MRLVAAFVLSATAMLLSLNASQAAVANVPLHACYIDEYDTAHCENHPVCKEHPDGSISCVV
ncbi:hypothetical protein ACH4SP_04360 [Streptomyces sp. NPDC021093]|uniref:hypothetical protein n=1 Tax=Streptomyces sp. NPDC021093 TaxID=3365112 RepID=UPI0037B372C1